MTKKRKTAGRWPDVPPEVPQTQPTKRRLANRSEPNQQGLTERTEQNQQTPTQRTQQMPAWQAQPTQPTQRTLLLHTPGTSRSLLPRSYWFTVLAGLIIVLPLLIEAGEVAEQLFLDLYILPPALLTRLYGARIGYLVALAQAFLLRLEERLAPQRHPRSSSHDLFIIAGSLAGVLLIQQISRLEQRLRERDLASQTWDPLTGALSRNAFLTRVWELIQRTPGQRRTTPDQPERTTGESTTKLLIGYLDLKDFEAFNQRWQWDTGDETLMRLAEILRSILPPGSPVARITSDEFAFCQVLSAEELNDFDPTRFIAHVQKTLVAVEPRAKDLEIHLGLAVYPEDGDKPEKLLWRAQRAMLEAQQKDSGQTELYRSMVDFLEVFQTHRSEDRLLNSAMTLLAVIDARDHYTGGHSIRVSRYAEILGRELGWPQDQLKVLALGALLHDLGKIEISRSILNKKERLTDDEWSLIRLHPLFGVAVVSALGYMDDVIPIIRGHHERPDGQGYPDALSGAQIPEGALLIGVVDAYDSMRSHRPYRQALPRERAEAVLRELSGRQFDPRLVDAFLQLDLSLIEKERHLVYFRRAASG